MAPRIGYLTSGGCPRDGKGAPSPLLEGLRARGYVIGQTIAIECRFSDQADDQPFRALTGELIESKVDVIVGVSSTATRALAPFTSTIRVVALDLETDPIASGLAASSAASGSK